MKLPNRPWLLVAVLLATFGCSTPREYKQLTRQIGEYGLQVYEDKARGALCYVYRDDDAPSLSCVKVEK